MKAVYVTVRVNEAEKKEIESMAERANLSVSEFIRKIVLNEKKNYEMLVQQHRESQDQFREIKNTLSIIKDSIQEKDSSTKNLISEMIPYIIKSSVVTDIQMNHQDDEEMKLKYREVFANEINQSKRANLVKESFKV